LDTLDLAKVAITAFVSATGAVVVWSWKLSAILSKHEQKHQDHDRRAGEIHEHVEKTEKVCESRVNKLESEVDRQSQEQQNRWNEFNRTLGQIQGELASRKR